MNEIGGGVLFFVALILGVAWLLLPFLILGSLKKLRQRLDYTNELLLHGNTQRAGKRSP